MKKTFTILIAAIAAILMITQPMKTVGQQVTYDFTTTNNFYTDSNLTTHPSTGNTNTLNAFYYTGGSEFNAGGKGYFNSGYFMLGKKDATLQLPTFSFNVKKIVVVGNSGASGSTGQNIYVGSTAVSTATTGSTGTNTYVINSSYQASGTTYLLKVTTAHNAQITSIQIYRAYTVSYDAGTGSGTMTDNNTYAQGDQVTIKSNTFTPPSGYSFNGWDVRDASNNVISVTNGKFTMPASNVTVTAQWQSTGYTVTYDCNGATSGCPDPNVITGVPAGSYTLVDEPSKTDHTFGGWNDGSTTYNAGEEYTISGNVTFTAQWIPVFDYINVTPTSFEITAASASNNEVAITTNIDDPSYEVVYYTSSTCEEATTKPAMIGDIVFVDNTLVFDVNANDGVARHAYFKVKAGEVLSEQVVTVNQAAITVNPPTFSLLEGSGTTIINEDVVLLGTTTPGATIYYTMGANPADPTSTSYEYDPDNGIEVTASTTIKAIAIKNGVSSSVASTSYTVVNPYTSMSALYAAATSSSKSVYVTFNNWTVVAVKGNNAFVTDGQYGVNIYQSGHGFTAGKTISGTVQCNLVLYNSGAELTGSNLSATNEDLTIGNAESITPYEVTLSDDIDGKYYGSYVDLGILTYDATYTTFDLDDDNWIYYTNNFSVDDLPTLTNGKTYRVKGVVYFTKSSNTLYRRIAPRVKSDIVEYNEPSITASNVDIAYDATSGEISYTINNPVDGGTVTADIQSGNFLSNLDYTTYSNKVTFEASANASTSERESVVRITYTYNTNETVTKDVTVTQAGVPTYTVSYNAGGGTGTMTDANSPYIAGATVTLLTNTFTAPEDKMWNSWQVKDEDDGNVTVTDGKFTMPTKNVTVTAQWINDPNAPTYAWVETSLASLTSNDIFVIVGTRTDDTYGGSYALPNNDGTSNPSAESITITNNKLASSPANEYKWNISGNATDGYTFYPNGDDKNWLYCTNANQGVRVGTGDNKLFKFIDGGTVGEVQQAYYIYNTGQSRYVGLYNAQDWRCYKSINDNIKNQSFTFYKRVLAKEITGVDNGGGYYLISSPLTASLTPSIANGFLREDGETDYYDLYYFDQAEDKEWKNYKQNTFSIASGKGYLYANISNTTLLFDGVAYNGDGNVTLNFTPEAEFEGWNLIGNPFPSKAYLANRNFYKMNDDGDEIIISENNLITPMEGIFVHAEDAYDNVTFTTTEPAKRASDSRIVINIIGSNDNVIDRAIVRLGEGSSLEKLMINNDNTKVYIPQDNVQYALAVSNAKGNMPVNFKAAEMGKYTISVNVEGIDMDYLHLIDRLTGEDVNLLLDNSYSFIATKQDMESRFILSFTANGNNNETDETFAYQNGSEIIVTGSGELQIFDVTGRSVMTTTINGYESVNVSAQGVYILRLIGTEIKTQKIVVR